MINNGPKKIDTTIAQAIVYTNLLAWAAGAVCVYNYFYELNNPSTAVTVYNRAQAAQTFPWLKEAASGILNTAPFLGLMALGEEPIREIKDAAIAPVKALYNMLPSWNRGKEEVAEENNAIKSVELRRSPRLNK